MAARDCFCIPRLPSAIEACVVYLALFIMAFCTYRTDDVHWTRSRTSNARAGTCFGTKNGSFKTRHQWLFSLVQCSLYLDSKINSTSWRTLLCSRWWFVKHYGGLVSCDGQLQSLRWRTPTHNVGPCWQAINFSFFFVSSIKIYNPILFLLPSAECCTGLERFFLNTI